MRTNKIKRKELVITIFQSFSLPSICWTSHPQCIKWLRLFRSLNAIRVVCTDICTYMYQPLLGVLRCVLAHNQDPKPEGRTWNDKEKSKDYKYRSNQKVFIMEISKFSPWKVFCFETPPRQFCSPFSTLLCQLFTVPENSSGNNNPLVCL